MFPAGVKKEALYSRNIGDSRFERRHTMKHAWKKLLAAAVLPCLLAGCGALGGPESEVPSMDHLLGLTQEQRLEDYDYLVQTLGDKIGRAHV